MSMQPRALAGGVAIGFGLAPFVPKAMRYARRALFTSVDYKLHVYDHCPFCNRVEWLMHHYGIAYERVVYGYGAGGDPKKSDGHGYGVGPVPLTGKKMLPVLEGEGVPCEEDAKGMGESMEICAFLIATHQLVVPCESGRDDIKKFTAELTALKPQLVEHRMVRMPIADWADPRDIAYRRYKKKLPQEVPPVAQQPELLADLNRKLAEVPSLLRGETCLNVWGWSMDDVVLLPLLRAFTVVEGARFPPQVEAYMSVEKTQMVDYRLHAL